MLEETNDSEEIIERVAALDIGKAELVCCVRVPGEGKRGKRLQEVKTYPTMTRSLLVLVDRLGVTRVVMEATGDYWKPVVRHEVPCVRAEVKGLRCGLSQQAVEAGGSLTWEAPGRVGAALTTTGQASTAKWLGPG